MAAVDWTIHGFRFLILPMVQSREGSTAGLPGWFNPIGSIDGISTTYIYHKFMVHVGKWTCTIHWILWESIVHIFSEKQKLQLQHSSICIWIKKRSFFSTGLFTCFLCRLSGTNTGVEYTRQTQIVRIWHRSLERNTWTEHLGRDSNSAGLNDTFFGS